MRDRIDMPESAPALKATVCDSTVTSSSGSGVSASTTRQLARNSQPSLTLFHFDNPDSNEESVG
jgi:hypothetical protein